MTIQNRGSFVSEYLEDDVISYCGIVTAHSLAQRRSDNGCSLKKHQINVVAKKLRNLSVEENFDIIKDGSLSSSVEKRFNSSFHQYRFIVACLGGFAIGLVFLLRYSISVAIIQMVNQTALYMEMHPNKTVEDFLAEGYTFGGEFDWNNEVQQMIMSWYMIAHSLPQLPCTRLALMFGHRKAIPILLTVCALSSILTPPAAYLGWEWVLILRLIQGIGAAAIMPMQLGLIENWMPYDEMGLGVTCINLIPSIFLPAIPIFIGYLCDIHWTYAFYIPGVITIVFCFIWYVLVSDQPDENWLVSQKELSIICTCNDTDMQSSAVENSKTNKNNVKEKQQEMELYRASWIDPFKIPSFYAILIMWILQCSSMNNFLFLLPTYLRQFLKIGISLNGIYCSLIQIGSIFAILWAHPFIRILEINFKLSLTTSRRITYFIVVFMVGGSWLLIGLFHKHQLIILMLNRCFHSTTEFLVIGTIMSNYAKLGLSSTAYSIVNGIGDLIVVLTSTFIGYILDLTGSSQETWSWIFISGSVTQFIMLLIYSIMIDSNPITIRQNSTLKGKNIT